MAGYASLPVRTGPSTSAGAVGHRRLACPMHGTLDPHDRDRCPECGRKPYQLDDDSDRALLTNLRRVARSQRMNVARLVGFTIGTPMSFVLMALATGRLTFSAAHVLLIVGATAGFAVPIERMLRRLTPHRLRAVDRELLESGAGLNELVGP
jgi:hypothetical protein